MKNSKISYFVIVILTIGLISCVFMLFLEKYKKNNIPETTQLLSKLTDMVHGDIDETLGEYDFLYEGIEDDIDSFRIYSEYEPFYGSDAFKDFFKRCVSPNEEIQKQLFDMLNSYPTYSKEFLFFKELVDFVFITRMERRKLENLCLFDDVGVQISPKKDTISKGEEYIAYIGYSASFYQTIPTMIIDGDTVSAGRDTQIFKETPQKAGHVKHKCMITFNWQGHIIEMPFTIEYYVK